MNWIRASVVAILIGISIPTSAMTVRQFQKMSGDDKDQYVTDLIQCAKKSLMDNGRPTEAEKIEQLFADSDKGAKQFYMTLALAGVHDAKTGEQTDVADVLAVCLETNEHIKLPDSYFALADKLKLNQLH